MSTIRITSLGLSLAAILAATPLVRAQAPAEAPDITAYRSIANEKDPAKVADLADKFLAQTADAFKNSQYRDPVFRVLAFRYFNDLKAYDKVVDLAERVQQLHPKAPDTTKMEINQMAMQVAFNNLKPPNVSKGLIFADHILAINPADLSALIATANVLVENLPTEPAAQEAALKKVTDAANKMIAATKPAQVSDAQWQPIMAQMHADLGYVALIRAKNLADAKAPSAEITEKNAMSVKHYDDSLKLNAKVDLSWYRRALALKYPVVLANNAVGENNKKDTELYDQMKALGAQIAASGALPKPQQDELKAKYEGMEAQLKEVRAEGDKLEETMYSALDVAIDSLASAVALAGPSEKAAKTELDRLYMTRHQGLDGLPELIAKKKEELK